MSNYYPLLERVIASLSNQTDEARDIVYRTALTALTNQLGLASTFSQKDVLQEHTELTLAIVRIERKFGQHTTSHSSPADRANNAICAKANQSDLLDVYDPIVSEPAVAPLANDLSTTRDPLKGSRGGISSSTTLLAANLSEAILPFFRNIALARLMPPSQFGLAISLSVVLGIVEVLTDFGLPIFAVRRDTPAPPAETMNTLQTLTLIRSTVLAVVFVVISPWIAAAFGAPDSVWTYALLGPIALIRGFENLGTKEAMRDFVFWREAVALASAQVVWVLVTVLMASLTHTFECMIWGMLSGTVAMLIMTHALSPRRFRLGWNQIARVDATRFGRPLIVNGIAVALSMADRLLVGSLLGPVILAMYNVGYGTAMLPRTVMTKFLTSAFLPLFVRDRERSVDGVNLRDTWAWCLSSIGLFYGLSLTFVGDKIIGLVFTEQYRPSRLFMTIAGVSVCIKFLMLLPIPAAYASGNTKLVSLGSSLSASIVIPGALILFLFRNVTLFLGTITIAEFLALMVFVGISIRTQVFTRNTTWIIVGFPIALLSSLSILTIVFPDLTFSLWATVGIFIGIASAFLYVYILSHFRIGLRLIIGR